MISMTCPGCGHSLNIPDEYLGQWGACKHCGGRIRVEQDRQNVGGNFGPGSVVPRTGRYRCLFCGEGGMADGAADMFRQMGLGEMMPAELRQRSRVSTVRQFEAGDLFPECPNCASATGWVLEEDLPLQGTTAPPQRDEHPTESLICDVCDGKVFRPDGHLLTTQQVVSAAGYWKQYFELQRSYFRAMGVASFEDFCKNKAVRLSCAKKLADQTTPWLVCDRCIQMFAVDAAVTRGYAQTWWSDGRKFTPPGTGPAPVSSVWMGDAASVRPTPKPAEPTYTNPVSSLVPPLQAPKARSQPPDGPSLRLIFEELKLRCVKFLNHAFRGDAFYKNTVYAIWKLLISYQRSHNGLPSMIDDEFRKEYVPPMTGPGERNLKVEYANDPALTFSEDESERVVLALKVELTHARSIHLLTSRSYLMQSTNFEDAIWKEAIAGAAIPYDQLRSFEWTNLKLLERRVSGSRQSKPRRF